VATALNVNEERKESWKAENNYNHGRQMKREVEIASLDLRYEEHRMKDRSAEKRLLNSILEQGIRDALLGVELEEGCPVLLDGFKRLRCARTLGMGLVPYSCIGKDEGLGIVELLRVSNQKKLTIIEQAKFIDELATVHQMTVGEIASHLEMSKAWVSLRAGMIKEMGEVVQKEIFKGKFPAYSYMYTLRPFMRINKIKRKEIEDFVSSVSGQGMSVRDIERLAGGYFKGPSEFREQIKNGNIAWGLARLKDSDCPRGDCTKTEEKMLRDLEIVQKYMQRVIFLSTDGKSGGNGFLAQVNLLAGGALGKISSFEKALRVLYDRSGQASGDLPASSGRSGNKIDQPPAAGKPKNRQSDYCTQRGDAPGSARR
jgi:predicted transcriptional regulator